MTTETAAAATTDINAPQRTRHLKQFDQLADLAHTLIGAGARSPAATEQLIAVLQEFTHVTLPLKDNPKQLRREQLMALSLLFSQMKGLTVACRQYVNANNIRYVGELYYITPPATPPQSPLWHQQLLKYLLTKYRLPLKLDPMARGWEPPYMETLDQPVAALALSVATLRDLEDMSIETVGQLVQWKAEDLVHNTIRGHKVTRMGVTEIEKRLATKGLFLNLAIPPRVKRLFPDKQS